MEIQEVTGSSAFSPEYIALAILGIVMHVLVKIMNRNDKSKPVSFKSFWSESKNRIRVVLSVVSVAVILLLADDIADLMQIQLSDGSPARRFLAFLAGYLNHSLIRELLKSFNRKQSNQE